MVIYITCWSDHTPTDWFQPCSTFWCSRTVSLIYVISEATRKSNYFGGRGVHASRLLLTSRTRPIPPISHHYLYPLLLTWVCMYAIMPQLQLYLKVKMVMCTHALPQPPSLSFPVSITSLFYIKKITIGIHYCSLIMSCNIQSDANQHLHDRSTSTYTTTFL